MRRRRHGGRTIQHPSGWCESTRHDAFSAMYLKRRRGEGGAHKLHPNSFEARSLVQAAKWAALTSADHRSRGRRHSCNMQFLAYQSEEGLKHTSRPVVLASENLTCVVWGGGNMLCVVEHAVAGPNACMHGGDRAGQDTRVALAGTAPADRSCLMCFRNCLLLHTATPGNTAWSRQAPHNKLEHVFEVLCELRLFAGGILKRFERTGRAGPPLPRRLGRGLGGAGAAHVGARGCMLCACAGEVMMRRRQNTRWVDGSFLMGGWWEGARSRGTVSGDRASRGWESAHAS